MPTNSPRKQLAATAIAVAILSACNGQSPRLDLIDSKPKLDSIRTEELERLKQLELIRLTPVDSSGNALPTITVDVNKIELEFETGTECDYHWQDMQTSGVNIWLMYGQAPLCWAHRLLGAIQPSRSIRLNNDSGFLPNPSGNAVAWMLGPQSAAANVALARSAKSAARTALVDFDRLLKYSIDYTYNDTEFDVVSTDPIVQRVLGTQTLREGASNYFIEAFNVIEEATKKEVDGMVSYGDFQRANPSITQGVDEGVLGLDLSRAAATHALAGGGPGLQLATAAGISPSPFRPVCSRPNLSPGGRMALDIMRQAALRPTDVMRTSLTIDDLVNGASPGCGSQTCGSVKQRLALYAKDTSTPSSVDVQVRFGLSIGDFTEARDYLRDELTAYRRYPGQIDPASTDAFPKFGGTATTPLVPDKGFYRALVDGTPNDPSQAIDGSGVDRSTYDYSTTAKMRQLGDETLSLADELDVTLSHVQAILASPTAKATGSEVGYRPLVAFAGEGYRRRIGRMTLSTFNHGCTPPTGNTCVTMTYSLAGVPSGQGYRVAFGDQAMECMTKGGLDGYACSLATYNISIPNSSSSATIFGGGGFTSVIYENRTFPVSTDPAFNSLFPGERVYLLRPRTQQSNDNSAAPGEYEAIGAGVVPDLPLAYKTKYATYPLIPEFDQKVRDLLAPSTAWCTQQEVSCSGGHFDERLPLENELTQDGTTSESSWRHYLDLAKAAASEADAIGSEMVQHGLDLSTVTENQAEAQRDRDEAQRVQVEQTLEELQNICGTSVDARTLLSGFSSDPQNNNLDQEPTMTCSTDADCSTSPNSRCYGGRCILDPVKVAQGLLLSGSSSAVVSRADAQRLVSCIGEDSIVPLATLGTRPMCVWIPPGGTYPNSYCQVTTPKEGNNPYAVCPSPAGKVTSNGQDYYSCIASGRPTPAYSTRLVQETLGFFDNSEDGQADAGPVDTQCAMLAALRGLINGVPIATQPWTSAADGAAQIIASNRLHVDSLKLLAPDLGWDPTIEGYSSITFKGTKIFTTGVHGAPATTGWPCDPGTRTGPAGTLFGPPPVGPSPGPSFAANVTCSDSRYRAYINQRMRDAVMAAQATTINKFAHITWPTTSLDGVSAPTSTSQIGTAFGTTLPLFLDQHAERDGIPALSIYRTTGNWNFWSYDDNVGFVSGLLSGFVPAGAIPSEDGDTAQDSYPFQWVTRQEGKIVATNVYSNFVPEMIWYGAGKDGHADVRTALASNFGTGQNDPRQAFANMLYGLESGPSFGGFYLGHNDFVDSLTRSYHPVPGGFRVNGQTIWDAAELMCASGGATVAPNGVVTSAEDVDRSATYLEQTADLISVQSGRRVFAKFPKFARDAVRKEGVKGAYPALGGQMAEQVSQLRSTLIDMSAIGPKMASELRLFAGDLKTYRALLKRNGLERDINSLQYTSEAANNLTQCVLSVMDVLTSNGILGTIVGGGKAVATCANAGFQTSVAERIKDTKNAISSIDDQVQFSNFANNFETRSQALKDLSDLALKLTEDGDGHLAEIERLRQAARRALDHAIVMDSFSNQVHYHSNDVMRTRLNTDAVRYGERLEDAKRLSFVAKRAIEQRIGIHLSEMNFNLPLVDAPANWEAQLCTLQGIDYSAIDSASSVQSASKAPSYASGYIGDYVSKLEKVVESYVLSSNFHEGHDTSVISLKDDVVKATQSCEAPSRNLLAYTSDLSHLSSDSLAFPGWEIAGCMTHVVNGVTTALPECISVSPDPTQLLSVEGNSVPGFLIRRGPRCATSAGGDGFTCGEAGTTIPTCPSSGCGLADAARLRQRVSLGAGKFRISYYTKAQTTASGTLFGVGGLRVIADPDGTGVGATLADGVAFKQTYLSAGVETLSGYKRVFADFSLTAPQIVSIEIGLDRLAQPTVNAFQTQTLTGVMLEDITRYTPSASTPLSSPFASTGETLTSTDGSCPDTDGSAFRRKAWVRNCLSLCNNGYGDTCSEAGLSRECFWELNFPISQRLIESGRQLSSAGFAKGNFNYRIQNVAVNFVGTGLRDCTDQPESCNGAGFVQYSLSHQGPFFVRNHFGGTFEAKLFDGNIEHARGLGIERYITNPISSSDSSLLEPYMHAELNGRPMDGNFVLRIWERPDLDLSKITDVQVVMEYGYWTRFN